MITIDKVLYTAQVHTTGGREGRAVSDDKLLDVALSLPPSMGGKGGSTNPEQLFAAGYSACYMGALRFHFGEVLLSSLARAGVILLLGVPLLNVVVFETLLALSAMFHHSNVRLPPRLEKALSWTIVTPSIHWVHHHAIRHDTDSNYSSLLSLWDRLFLSRSATKRSPDMPIGTEGLDDRALPGLIARPFEHR